MCSFMAVIGGLQAGAQIAGAAQQNKAAKAQAIEAQQQARYEAQRTFAEAEQMRAANAREVGAMRAAFAPRGVALDSASAVDVIAGAAGELSYPALMKEHDAQLALHRGQVRARQIRDAGAQAMRASILGSVLDFAGQGASSNSRRRQPGGNSIAIPVSWFG